MSNRETTELCSYHNSRVKVVDTNIDTKLLESGVKVVDTNIDTKLFEIVNIVSQLSCEAMLKISSKNIEK